MIQHGSPVVVQREVTTCVLWDPSSPRVSRALRMDDVCLEAGWSPDGTMLYGERDDVCLVVDASDGVAGEVVASVPAVPYTTALWSPDGSLLFVRDIGAYQQLWRIDATTYDLKSVGPNRASLRLLAISPHGDRVLLATVAVPVAQDARGDESPQTDRDRPRPPGVVPIREALETLRVSDGAVLGVLPTDWYIEAATWPVPDVAFALTSDMAWQQAGRYAPGPDRVCRIELDTGCIHTIDQPAERVWLLRDLRHPLPELRPGRGAGG